MFSASVERALRAAIAAHEGQFRKCEEPVPYAVHPLHVAILLARLRVDDDVLVAGLMHDVVEDCPGWDVARVQREFGAHAAGIVAELTEDKSRSWEERKRAGIERVAHLSPDAATVRAADQLHNLQTLLLELGESADPDAVWARFRGGRERTLAMGAELVEALAKRIEPRLARSLRGAQQALVDQDRRSQRGRVRS